MIYRVKHDTTYQYLHEVSISHNVAHLCARDSVGQSRLNYKLTFSVPPAVLAEQVDYFGNPVTYFTVQEPHRTLTIRAENLVDVRVMPMPHPGGTMPWEQTRDLLRSAWDAAGVDAYQFTFDSPYVRAGEILADYARPSFFAGRPVLEGVLDLTGRIHNEFQFDPTALADVLRLKRGVCQDFAHLQIGCLRSLGLAARYMSGYLETDPPPGRARQVGADASHAWLSVFCPGHGWVDIDPTNNIIPGDRHVVLAWGRDYDDVSPLKGVILGGGGHTLKVAVDVQAVNGPSD
jgi:transglutaminase-like putative cysteine protease